jgi:hypothetical protein
VVVEARTDFHFRTKPLGFALVKHLQPLQRWLHVLDHAEVLTLLALLVQKYKY